ncbi:hypothetical protein N431DRAFT_563165 [Stipitochalara longipes BDJ]|nr:hypothetical protein N431DRAFT_563165 [Stipitochalara longipes BDJ]
MPPLTPAPPVSTEALWKAYKTHAAKSPAPPNLQPQLKVLTAEKDGIPTGNVCPTGTMNYWEFNDNDAPGYPLNYYFQLFGPQPEDGFSLFIGLHGGGGPTIKGTEEERQEESRTTKLGSRWLSGTMATTSRLRNLILPNPLEAKEWMQKNPKDKNPRSQNGEYVCWTPRINKNRQSRQYSDLTAGGRGDGNSTKGNQYARNQWTAKKGQEFLAFQNKDQSYYKHAVFTHPAKELMKAATAKWEKEASDANTEPNAHNIWEYQELWNHKYDMFDQQKEWKLDPMPVNGGDFFDVPADQNHASPFNTCAALWVSRESIDNEGSVRVRNPIPPLIIWDVSTRGAEEGEPLLPSDWKQHRFHYWLAVPRSFIGDDKAAKDAGKYIVWVSYTRDTNENSIWIEKTPTQLLILLNEAMLDLKKPTTVYYGIPQASRQTIAFITVKQDLNIQKATLMARGDPKLIFSAAITFDSNLKKAANAGLDIFSSFFESPKTPKFMLWAVDVVASALLFFWLLHIDC